MQLKNIAVFVSICSREKVISFDNICLSCLSCGRQFMFYALMDYHQVAAQTVLRLLGDIKSYYKIASLSLRPQIDFSILKHILMLSCGSSCVGWGTVLGVLSGRCSLQFGVISVNARHRDLPFGKLFACYSILWSHDFVSFPGLTTDKTPGLWFFKTFTNWKENVSIILGHLPFHSAGLQSIRCVECNVVDDYLLTSVWRYQLLEKLEGVFYCCCLWEEKSCFVLAP